MEMAPAAASASSDASPWRFVGTVGVGVVLVLAGLAMRTPRAESRPSAAAAPASAQNRTAAVEARPVDTTVLAQNQSLDSQRVGYTAYAGGDLNKALLNYQQAVYANPDDPEAHNNLAQVLVRLNRVSDALPHFDEAIRLNSQKWSYRFNRARAYAQIERLSDAVTDYRAAAALFPEDYATYYNLGLILLKTKEYPEAVTAFERAVALAPGEPSFLISLGTAYVAAEQRDRAKTAFEQFLSLAPNDAESPKVRQLIAALIAADAS
jgi:Flp pilus assembly protein TadD